MGVLQIGRSDRASEAVSFDPASQRRIVHYIEAAKAPSTVRAYGSDLRHFTSWCEARGLSAVPAEPETVAAYLTELADGGSKASTIRRRVSSISKGHKVAGAPNPTTHEGLRTVLAGIRRELGTAEAGKAPATTAELRRMVATLGTDRIGIRDRAVLLLGFAGAFRRSELAALNVEDITDTDEGLVVTVRRSKTDQAGAGRKLGIPYGSNPATCPVRAFRAWLEVAELRSGPLFPRIDRAGRGQPMSAQAVAIVVKRAAGRAGLDAADFAGHSLRAGLATSAAAAGVSERVIAEQTGHRSMAVLRRYIREGSLFRENAAAAVGL
ncbi:MAG: site-specific integrase [Acidimicrobiales bacterium]